MNFVTSIGASTDAAAHAPWYAWAIAGAAVGLVAISGLLTIALLVARPFRRSVELDAEAFVPLANTQNYRMHQDRPSFQAAWLEVGLWVLYCLGFWVFAWLWRLVRGERTGATKR
jgi:hypothetical protein